jgi:hypothetical protein
MGYVDKSIIPSRHTGAKRHAAIGIQTYIKSNITVSGTAVPTATEAQIVTGGRTVILTLNTGKWIPSGTLFNAQRTAIRNGLDSAQAEATGWDALIATIAPAANVVRTNDKTVTITLQPAATYAIGANETITVTVPYAAIEFCKANVVASPTFTIAFS